MTALQVMALVLVAGGAVAVVAVRDPVRLVFVNALYGLLLAALFVVFQAPDVGLSELVVGAIALPLALIVTLAKERGE